MGTDHVARNLVSLRRIVLYLVIPALLVVGAGLVVLGEYALGRQSQVDRTAQHNREAICAVLNAIPPRHRSPAIEKARRIDSCGAVHLPPATPPHIDVGPSSPRPTATSQPPVTVVVTPKGRHTVIVRPTARPHPTVTRTRTAEPQPSHSSTPTPHPSETCLNPPNPLPKVCR